MQTKGCCSQGKIEPFTLKLKIISVACGPVVSKIEWSNTNLPGLGPAQDLHEIEPCLRICTTYTTTENTTCLAVAKLAFNNFESLFVSTIPGAISPRFVNRQLVCLLSIGILNWDRGGF